MKELDPRAPHRRYFAREGDGGYIVFDADERGLVEVTEEALSNLIMELGYREVEETE